MKQTSIKLGLITFGFLTGLIFIELGLQLGHLVRAEHRQAKIQPILGQSLRILCIGESTTESGAWLNIRTWTSILELELRARFKTNKIEVINRGIVGANSRDILNKLDKWLLEFKPQVVISMLGINDDLNVLIDQYTEKSLVEIYLDRLRSWRLLKMLWRTLTWNSPINLGAAQVSAQDSSTDNELQKLFEQRKLASHGFKYINEIEALGRLALTAPGTPVYHYGRLKDILVSYSNEDEWTYARKSVPDLPEFKHFNEASSKRIAELIEKAILDPWLKLRLQATVFSFLGQREAEENLLRLATLQSEIANLAWFRLAIFYLITAQGPLAESALAQAVKLDHPDYPLKTAFALALFHQQEFDLAAKYFQTIPADYASARNTIQLRQSAMALFISGSESRAQELFNLDSLRSLQSTNSMTLANYSEVAKKVRNSGALLVAMQYPVLSIEPLKRMLAEQEVALFVDNEKVFKNAVKQYGYFDVFYDLFAGSFGHTTEKGNEILALHLANELMSLLRIQE